MPEVMETAGDVIQAGANVETTIRARVFDENGKLIEDLGVIVGKRSKKDSAKTDKALKRLRARYDKEQDRLKQARLKEAKNGG